MIFIKTPKEKLEKLTQLEMQLPSRRAPAEQIRLVESIPQVDAERSERAQRRGAESHAPEQPRRVELARTIPDVAALRERVHVQRRRQPQSQLGRGCKVRVSERFATGRARLG